MQRKIRILFLAMVIAGCLIVTGFGNSASAMDMASKEGIFKVSYTSEPEAIPIGQMISWKLLVLTADGEPVVDAKISIEGGMPAHGHGLPTRPQVTKNLGQGNYLIEGLKFSMPGRWVVTFIISSGGKTDSVTFPLQLQ